MTVLIAAFGNVWLSMEVDVNAESNVTLGHEVEELETFLYSERSPEFCMDISTLDGFLAAIALNPDVIPIDDWSPWVWDMHEGIEELDFGTPDELQRIMNLLEDYYAVVITAIQKDCFAPLFYVLSEEDGITQYDADSWSEGFLIGVSVFIDPWWRSIVEDRVELVAPMLLLGTEDGWKMLAESDNEEAAICEAYDSIPEAIKVLYAHFEIHRLMRVGEFVEEDLCQCGSGKEFRQCCGYQGLLH